MKPLPRREVIRKLKTLGFEGPLRIGHHRFMRRGSIALRIPDPECAVVSVNLQQALIRQVEIDTPVWMLA